MSSVTKVVKRPPPTTLGKLLTFFGRQVWSSPSYFIGVTPFRSWRVPPFETPEPSRENTNRGMSVFFYPASSMKKNKVHVSGPLGEIEQRLPWTALDVVKLPKGTGSHEIRYYANNGTKTFVSNAVSGVHEGYAVIMTLFGVGYRCEVKDDGIHLRIGLSKPVKLPFEQNGVKYTVIQPTRLQVAGVDVQKVHKAAAELRRLRPPDPYKGKGIRFEGERVKLRPGKKNE